MPDKAAYGYSTMNKAGKVEFDSWYDASMTFNYQKEMFEYCFSDVEIHSRGCLEYRNLFLQISLEDPFQYITIAQLCIHIYKHMIPVDTIGIMKNTAFKDIQSNSFGWNSLVGIYS
jgi:hypothetical protein